MNRNVITGVAPELRVSQWIDAEGQSIAPLKRPGLGGGFEGATVVSPGALGAIAMGFPP